MGLALVNLVGFGCVRDSKVLDKNARNKIETLARMEMIRRDDSLTRICDSLYYEVFNSVKDSVYAVRQREILDLILQDK